MTFGTTSLHANPSMAQAHAQALTGGSPGMVQPTMPEVHRESSNAAEAAGTMHALLSDLVTRLRPVMHTPPAPDNCAAGAPPCSTQIASSFRMLADKSNEASDAIRYVLANLAI